MSATEGAVGGGGRAVGGDADNGVEGGEQGVELAAEACTEALGAQVFGGEDGLFGVAADTVLGGGQFGDLAASRRGLRRRLPSRRRGWCEVTEEKGKSGTSTSWTSPSVLKTSRAFSKFERTSGWEFVVRFLRMASLKRTIGLVVGGRSGRGGARRRGRAGSGPAMASRTRPQSRAVWAMGPILSRVQERAIAPARETRP